MTLKIVAFPPVAITAWTPAEYIAPVQRSQSLFTGQRYVSAVAPARRFMSLTVSPLSLDRSGGGYMDRLRQEIDHGVHLVRLTTMPVNWHLDRPAFRDSPVTWIEPPGDVTWENGGSPVRWFVNGGRVATATGTADDPSLTVTGLPANVLIARVGELVRVYASDNSSTVAQLRANVTSDPTGQAVARIDRVLAGGVVSFGDSDTFVAEVVGEIPQVSRRIGQNWEIPLNFREVLPHEYTGAVEVNPW